MDGTPSDDALIDGFLQGTSRTFALAIPLLAVERRRQIGLSYLLFRIADSIEDAPAADADTKCALLSALGERFSPSLLGPARSAEGGLPASRQPAAPLDLGGLWPDESPTGRLLRAFPRLMVLFESLPPAVSQAVGTALGSTVGGMLGFLEASRGLPHQIQVQSLADLRLYCYAVAGIVGEMLTDIFVCHHPPGQAVHGDLRRLAAGFGEFLQLVNILKDSRTDADGGRLFLPRETSRERVHELALAGRRDALRYVSVLESHDFPGDIVRFCRFILMLAEGSLEKLRDGGAGSKLTRGEVLELLATVASERASMPERGLAEAGLDGFDSSCGAWEERP
jgi:farnesyl-diphosphate farnesyltransferase